MRRKGVKAKKTAWELGIVVILIVITIYFNASGLLMNPFRVVNSESSDTVMSEFKKGTDYVKLTHASLDFTGYYKLNTSGGVVYNCYATEIDGNTYFVFVPPSSSGESEDIAQNLTNYSCIAKLSEDEDLFEMVAADYDLTTAEFRKNYGVSAIVFDEARSNQTEMIFLWILLFLAVFLCLGDMLLRLIMKWKNRKQNRK